MPSPLRAPRIKPHPQPQPRLRPLPLARAALVVALTLAFLLPATLSSLASGPPAPDFSVLNLELRREWSGYESDTKVRVILQFESPMTSGDWATLEGLGFEELRRYSVIHGAAGYLTAETLAKLSHYERIWWIEKDTLNEYALEQSTQTIRAASNWQRIVIDAAGQPRQEDGVELPVDGSGVTVVVADTGIDATHPDLDYREKVIENKKADVDGQPWVEMINTDNLFGHGTHVAGTVAGTGEASAGLRRGVAPGASLIGLGIGDPWETNEVGAFDWVYEHAAPPNPYNIRVITNSWGYESVDANWKDAVLQASQRVAYERNVVVTFAASNDGGDGSESRTNLYGNSPGMISVAASYREGGGIAGFSSRGDRNDNSTWPDVAAPGVEIWSARDTTGFIINTVAGDTNPYYTAISGTSMATPHVAGVAALLWQAAPSLRFSNTVDDRPSYDEAYLNDEWSRIHEVELILKLTSDYIAPDGGNGVPNEKEIGIVGREHDFAQGYGQVNVERAVALALTLEQLRQDDPQATVWQALPLYEQVLSGGLATRNVNGVRQQVQMFREPGPRAESSWFGEYLGGPNVAWGQTHDLFVPREASLLVADFFYDQLNYDQGQVGEIDLFVEDSDSGPQRLTLPDLLTPDGHKRVELPTETPPLSNLDRDELWHFQVSGYATRLEYLIELSLVMDGPLTLTNPTLRPEQVQVELPGFSERHTLRVTTKYYDLRNVETPPSTGPDHTLTVNAPDPDAQVAVYRAGVGDVALAAGPPPLELELPEDWYFALATMPGYWPSTSADFYLGQAMTVELPSLVEKDLELPYGKFLQPLGGTRVAGTVKVKLQLNDAVGLSSVTVTIGGRPVFSRELNGATDRDVSFAWDTTKLKEGPVTLKALVIDTDGNDVSLVTYVEVDNQGDSAWKYLVVVLAAVTLATLGGWMARGQQTHAGVSAPPGEEPAAGVLIASRSAPAGRTPLKARREAEAPREAEAGPPDPQATEADRAGSVGMAGTEGTEPLEAESLEAPREEGDT